MSSKRPSTPPSARHSRTSSINPQHHAPQVPSSLREAHIVGSPEDIRDGRGLDTAASSSNTSPNTYPTHPHTDPDEHEDDDGEGRAHGVGVSDFGSKVASETTALLKKPFEFVSSSPHAGPCNHGTFSPRLESRADSVRSGLSGHGYGFGGSPPRTAREAGGSRASTFSSFFENVGLKNGSGSSKKKMSTTSYLAERHGITNTTTMYVLKSQCFLVCE